MMCDCCDKQLTPAAAKKITVHGASGAGGTVYVHRAPCRPPRGRAASYPAQRG